MILGYQVKDANGSTWKGRPLNLVQSKGMAIIDLLNSRKFTEENSYNLIAVLDGDIKDPIFQSIESNGCVNTKNELNSLASEFEGCLTLSEDCLSLKDSTECSKNVVDTARRLVQGSYEDYTVVIPDNAESIGTGEGCGSWVPAMVYLRNRVIFDNQ